ncbi:succinate dehydrogenase cytochrome b subunit [Candidatus Marinamargulisbacteria bacterium]|nr:succinate dehydrogenase cytochrome b subunit [Candidatus Marinamargulisbacteria bacterium]MDG2265137.1 succinate dehydrogenase cytochrome b subunit [Candidatus Marinamargulisbacteria bacterium]|tara:strand:+ start:5574 stop:6257 length:684 start_codon:yes stop_codon:yes gene_type:complete
MIKRYIQSQIGKKQLVAISGLALVLFVMFHLSANLLLFLGPDYFNFFPELMHSTGIGLRFIEAGLASVFFAHIGLTVALVRQNRKARDHQYQTVDTSNRSIATRLMPYTGTLLLLFLAFHINDFVLQDHFGSKSMVAGESLGLYGLVYNAFANPFRVGLYVLGVFSLGFHLSHGIQSVVQTLGYHHPQYTPIIKHLSRGLGVLVAVLFASIPFYFSYINAIGCCYVS